MKMVCGAGVWCWCVEMVCGAGVWSSCMELLCALVRGACNWWGGFFERADTSPSQSYTKVSNAPLSSMFI